MYTHTNRLGREQREKKSLFKVRVVFLESSAGCDHLVHPFRLFCHYSTLLSLVTSDRTTKEEKEAEVLSLTHCLYFDDFSSAYITMNVLICSLSHPIVYACLSAFNSERSSADSFLIGLDEKYVSAFGRRRRDSMIHLHQSKIIILISEKPECNSVTIDWLTIRF